MVKNNFKQWCEDNNRIDLLELWDYELNEVLPENISIKTKLKIYFKCKRDLHKSESHRICDFLYSEKYDIRCTACRSFKQYVIDNFSGEYFEKIWSDKNTIDPYKITARNHSTKIKLRCPNREDHGNYITDSAGFYKSNGRCPKCLNLENNNSLGDKFPISIQFWSEINEKTPFDYSYGSNKKVWWKCQNGKHEDYQRVINDQIIKSFYCPKCRKEEQQIKKNEEMIGKRFGLLTVIKMVPRTKKKQGTYWLCKCDCGETIIANTNALNTGNTKTCGNWSLHRSGSNAPGWKGGICPEHKIARSNNEYREWHKKVLYRDYYTCQCCGAFKNIVYNAHHLKNFSDNIDLRYEISNGITLCENCHNVIIDGSFHNIYGTTNNTPEQLEEYINNKRRILGINIPFSISAYLNGEILKPNMVKIAI